MSVINNTPKPESCLNKKSNIICYHFIREAVAIKKCLTTHVPTLQNFSDLLTKCLSGKKRRDLVRGILFDICDYVLCSLEDVRHMWQAARRLGHQNTRKYGGQQTARTMRDVTTTNGLSPYLTKLIVSYLALFASPLKFDSLKQIGLGGKSFIVIGIKQNPTN